MATGQSVEAEAKLRQVLELDPNFWLPYAWLSAGCLALERLDEALAFAEKAHSLASWNASVIGHLAGILERIGDKVRARKLIEKLGDGTAYGAPAGFFCYYASVPDLDRAIDWFEKAIEQRDTRAPWILPHLYPRLCSDEPLMSSPRWPTLAKMMNLPETV